MYGLQGLLVTGSVVDEGVLLEGVPPRELLAARGADVESRPKLL